MDWVVSLWNSCVGVLPSNVLVFGEGAFGTQLSLGEVMRVGASWWGQSPYKKRHQRVCLLFLPTYQGEERPCEQTRSRKAAICKRGRGPSPGTEVISTLILDFLSSRTVRNRFLLLKPLTQDIVFCYGSMSSKDIGYLRDYDDWKPLLALGQRRKAALPEPRAWGPLKEAELW